MEAMEEEACPLDPYTIVPQRTRFVDQQVLKVQEHPEDVPTGEMPRHVMCSIERFSLSLSLSLFLSALKPAHLLVVF